MNIAAQNDVLNHDRVKAGSMELRRSALTMEVSEGPYIRDWLGLLCSLSHDLDTEEPDVVSDGGIM